MAASAATRADNQVVEPALKLTPVQRFVFSVILFAVHQLCNVATSALLYLQFIWKISLSLLPSNECLTFDKISSDCRSVLTKRASHIAVALLEPANKMNLAAISEAVVWC
jgi:hypothetical protein